MSGRHRTISWFAFVAAAACGACACNAILDNEPRVLDGGDASLPPTPTDGATPPIDAPGGGDASPARDGDPVVVRDGSFDAQVDPGAQVPFRGLEIRHVVENGTFVVQCIADGGEQDVWQSIALGRSATSRLAEFKYSQMSEVFLTCMNEGGRDDAGKFPLVVTSAAAGDVPAKVEIAKCLGTGSAEIYSVTRFVQGHPAATYVRTEAFTACP